jgi:hypothetical protein
MKSTPRYPNRRLLITASAATMAAGAIALRAPGIDAQTDRALLDMLFVLEQIQTTHLAAILDTFDDPEFAAAGLPDGARSGVDRILQEETRHLGMMARPEGNPLPPPIRPEITTLEQALRDAIDLKNLTLGAYAGVIPVIGRPRMVPDLIGVHSVEARQLAWLLTLLGEDPFPDAVDPALAPTDVLARLEAMATGGMAPATPVASNPAVAPLLATIAAELGVSPDQLDVVQIEHQDWPDTSLGCPQPGHAYADVITPGYLIVVDVSGVRTEFHTDERGNVARCRD